MKKRKLFGTLQAKYMLIIIAALGIVQVFYLLSTLVVVGITLNSNEDETPEFVDVEEAWHEQANRIVADEHVQQSITALFAHWKEEFPEAVMFWVNGSGQLVHDVSVGEVDSSLPSQWDASQTVSFMKSRYGYDPFTVVAFVGKGQEHGFVVVSLPRDLFLNPFQQMYGDFGNWILIMMAILVVLFIFISYLFFRKIRKRLLSLQRAMHTRDEQGLPSIIAIKKMDEIGELEQSYNLMVEELNKSRQRQQDEERLRRELIANLSHDIRTPLTKVRANAYSLRKLELPAEANPALQAIDRSIKHVAELVDNLLAYTLLASHQYRYEPQPTNMDRLLREHIASWYEVFEQNKFDIEIKLEPLSAWNIDQLWMKRMMDNVLQNVHRHAAEGKYIGIETIGLPEYEAIRIVDHGPGFDFSHTTKGAGVGLSIVTMMTEGMNMKWYYYKRNNEFVFEIRYYPEDDNNRSRREQ